MSIEFTMRRISPDVYDRMMRSDGYFEYRYVAESGQIAKRWEVMAYILCDGDHTGPGPAAAVVGGQRLPGEQPEDQDFGGTRLLPAAAVAEVAAALEELTERELKRRYEELCFSGLYGCDAAGRPDFDVDVCLGDFRHLRAFYRAAAEAGNAMMLWLA